MTIEDLTPPQREEVQLSFLRSYLARQRRARFGRPAKPPVQRPIVGKQYDMSGRLVAEDGVRCAPRRTTFPEDRRRTPASLTRSK